MIDNPQVGDRVRVTTNIGGAHGSVGNVGTITEIRGRSGLGVKMDGASAYEGAFGDGVYSADASQVELVQRATPTTIGRGTRVRLTVEVDGVPRGAEGTVLRPLEDGYYFVDLSPEHSSGWYVRPSQLEAVAPSAPTPLRFEVGARVELTSTVDGIASGTVATIASRCCPGGTCWLVDLPGHPAYVVYEEQMKVLPPEETAPAPDAIPADASLADLRAQKERAERELQEFKDLVHRRVCEISAERNWCTDADAWLENLGLPPREEPEIDYAELGVPQGEYALVRMGTTLLVRKDDDDEPWYAVEGSGSGSYFSDAEVYDSGYQLLWSGRDW